MRARLIDLRNVNSIPCQPAAPVRDTIHVVFSYSRPFNNLSLFNLPLHQRSINCTLILRWKRAYNIMLVPHSITLRHRRAVIIRKQRIALIDVVARLLQELGDGDRVVETGR